MIDWILREYAKLNSTWVLDSVNKIALSKFKPKRDFENNLEIKPQLN